MKLISYNKKQIQMTELKIRFIEILNESLTYRGKKIIQIIVNSKFVLFKYSLFN